MDEEYKSGPRFGPNSWNHKILQEQLANQKKENDPTVETVQGHDEHLSTPKIEEVKVEETLTQELNDLVQKSEQDVTASVVAAEKEAELPKKPAIEKKRK